MQKISEVMTRDVRTITPKDTVRRAAQLMDELNVGAIPVCDGDKLVGMITDRDITVRSTAAGQRPDDTCVSDVMSTDVRTVFATESIEEALRKMSDVQIRRVPVIDEQTHKMVGIVSLGDMATRGPDSGGVEKALENISEPSQPDRNA